jgi:hypothetical protein
MDGLKVFLSERYRLLGLESLISTSLATITTVLSIATLSFPVLFRFLSLSLLLFSLYTVFISHYSASGVCLYHCVLASRRRRKVPQGTKHYKGATTKSIKSYPSMD